MLSSILRWTALALISNGGSWNHTVFKCLCGHIAIFGALESEEGEHFNHDVPASIY